MVGVNSSFILRAQFEIRTVFVANYISKDISGNLSALTSLAAKRATGFLSENLVQTKLVEISGRAKQILSS